jgi:hypothetical protein
MFHALLLRLPELQRKPRARPSRTGVNSIFHLGQVMSLPLEKGRQGQ